MQSIVVTTAVICALVLPALSNLADDVTPCEGVTRPTEIFVEGCEATPCTIRNGDTVNFEFVYYPPRASQNLTANVNLRLGSLAIPYTLSEHDQNACNGLIGTSCPIKAQVPLRYGLAMVVEAPITGVTVDLEFFLTDDQALRSVCFRYAQTII